SEPDGKYRARRQEMGSVVGEASLAETTEIVFEVRTGVADGSVEANTRGEGELASISANPGQDVVELELVDGPTLVLHPQHALELFAAQARAAAPARSGAVRVPTRLGWATSDGDRKLGRGLNEIGQVALRAF